MNLTLKISFEPLKMHLQTGKDLTVLSGLSVVLGSFGATK
jgi:hypothetical protein